MSISPSHGRRLLIAALAVAMLVVGFGAGYFLKPPSAETTTTLGQGTNPVNCVVYGYQVFGTEVNSNGSVRVTDTTQSYLVTDYISPTTIERPPGYVTSTSTDILNSMGLAWNSTICTWLPA